VAEALKDMYTKEFLSSFAAKVHKVYGSFDSCGFVDTIIDNTWEELKLKARMRRITETLGSYLPSRYEEALEVLFAIDEFCIGFPYLFFPDFVALYGQSEDNWEISMKALERFTIRSSSEFAVRPFIMSKPEQMTRQMLDWSKSSNEHVRRLASEGSRPRLPWGEALIIFKCDPTPVISILNQLKEDPSLYVRKSVANNLNDISKDNPSVIVEIIKQWKGVNLYTDWILRHGARTLIRKTNPEVMELFGYEKTIGEPITTRATLSVDPLVSRIGESCELKYELCIREGEPVHIRIEYGIDFVKARGKISRKMFLLSDKIVSGGKCLSGIRKHSWRDLTTRRHYVGEHKIVLLVNGYEIAFTTMKLNS
jgi:3-methyladenine DNA glycosylase AlkC